MGVIYTLWRAAPQAAGEDDGDTSGQRLPVRITPHYLGMNEKRLQQ